MWWGGGVYPGQIASDIVSQSSIIIIYYHGGERLHQHHFPHRGRMAGGWDKRLETCFTGRGRTSRTQDWVQHRAPITDDEGYDERSLSSEQQEELKGVFSYTNHLQIQHQWGPLIHRHYDYTARIRSEARAMGGPLSNIILCSLGGLVAGR